MYCTLDDIRKRVPEATLIQITDDQDLGVIDEDVVAEIGVGVDELIDGKLRGVYELPLSSVPGIIKAIALDLRMYELYARRPEFGIPDPVKEKYAAQMKVLDQIRSGAIKLGIGAVETPSASASSDGMLVSSGDQMFSKDVLDRY